MRNDGLGDRMKGQYESRTRYMLPRRTFTIIRVDGKTFRTYTRGCERPYDPTILTAMTFAAIALCGKAQGAKLGFMQSDEVSVVLTDFDRIETCAWFDGNLQKIASVSASVVTAAFNRAAPEKPTATFDARVFTIPDPTEVENYFIWRQKDAIRNSVQMLAQCHFPMLAEVGVDWHNVAPHLRQGTVIVRGYGDTEWAASAAPLFTDEPYRAFIKAALDPRERKPQLT